MNGLTGPPMDNSSADAPEKEMPVKLQKVAIIVRCAVFILIIN